MNRREHPTSTETCDPYLLFDADWYLAQTPEAAEAGMDPLEHYMRVGAAEGRDPHPLFDTEWYLAHNPEVADTGINPLEHYLRFGAAAGRDPHPFFFGRWYSKHYREVRKSCVNPLVDYVHRGAAAGRAPNPLFAVAGYRSFSPHDAFSGHFGSLSPATLVRSIAGNATVSDEWGALFQAYAGGLDADILRLVDRILSPEHQDRNGFFSPARAVLYLLKAECHLATGHMDEALAAAKHGVVLAPEMPGGLTVLKQCLGGRRRLAAPPAGFVALFITCEKHQDRGKGTYAALAGMGIPVKAVVGTGASIRADYDVLTVASGDFYEDLPAKIRDALIWLYETYESDVGVLKIDDDIDIVDEDKFRRYLAHITQSDHHYIGHPVGLRGATYRDFHFGKCRDVAMNALPYGRHGCQSGHADGAMYYLSGHAVERYYQYVHCYPGEMAGETLEDLFMGKVMERCGIPLQDARFSTTGVTPRSQ